VDLPDAESLSFGVALLWNMFSGTSDGFFDLNIPEYLRHNTFDLLQNH